MSPSTGSSTGPTTTSTSSNNTTSTSGSSATTTGGPVKGGGNGRKLLEFVKAEVTRGYQPELEEERFQARREKVYMFMVIPRELERLMGYGFFQCADAFLFLFTYLPLRVAFKLLSCIGFGVRVALRRTVHNETWGLRPADRCDIIKLGIFLFAVYMCTFIDTSVLYHVIKSQSVIKLYIFFNMLEVADRLFASFVQDTIDALLLTATEEYSKKTHKHKTMGLTGHILLTVLAVFGHSMVILLQGTTLSVAINASNRALLTVMMSNNFVELKGAVFKKFDKINLFQVSCSDIRERFHLVVLLMVVCLQTMREYNWEESRFWVLLPDCLMVLVAELFVDWTKHCFITRFNEIPAEIYREYTLSLAYDLAQTKQRRAFSDHSDMVGRRLGFVPLPLAVVLARVLRPSLNNGGLGTIILSILAFIALATFRTLNSIILLGKACDLIDHHFKAAGTTTTTTTTPLSPSHHQTQQLHPHVSFNYNVSVSQGTAAGGEPSSSSSAAVWPNPIKMSGTSSPPVPRDDAHPNSRSRTPSPIQTSYILQQDHLPEMRKPILQKKDSKHSKIPRSFSASHTPRPSIGSINEFPILPPLPSDLNYNDDTKLLQANSLVSILSVNLNEEMMAHNEQLEQQQHANAPMKLTRKHSLGSNLAESEDVLLAQPKHDDLSLYDKENLNLVDVGDKPELPSGQDTNVLSSESSFLDQTVFEIDKMSETEQDHGEATSPFVILSPGPASDPTTTSSSSGGELRQRVKRKSFTGWLKELGSSSSSSVKGSNGNSSTTTTGNVNVLSEGGGQSQNNSGSTSASTTTTTTNPPEDK